MEQVAKLVVLTKVTQSTKSLFHLDFRGSSRYKLARRLAIESVVMNIVFYIGEVAPQYLDDCVCD